MNAPQYHDPPRPTETVHAVELDGELVLYDSATNRTVHLDQQATLIWRVLDGSVTVGELVDDLSEIFGVDAPTVRADVEQMLSGLHGQGFLTPTGSATENVGGTVLPDPPSP